MAAAMNTVAMAQFADGLLGRAETFRQNRCGHGAGLDRSPILRGRCRLVMKIYQYVSTLFGVSVRTDLALKKADRRGSLRSSGMEHLGARLNGSFSMEFAADGAGRAGLPCNVGEVSAADHDKTMTHTKRC